MADQFEPVFKGMFAAASESVDRMRGLPALRADDAVTEPPDSQEPK